MIGQQIPFELHLTVTILKPNQYAHFEKMCLEMGGKPLLIELSRGEYTSQPMFNKTVYLRSFTNALQHAKNYCNLLAEHTFEVSRIKIEIPLAFKDNTEGHQPHNYFEWHGKVNYTRINELLELCNKHKVHLSMNALKGENGSRFITLREFDTLQIFDTRKKSLLNDIEAGKWTLLKQEDEFCIYDTNTALDKGWLVK